ncbi:MAG TPA: nuclear transport factor 2 family protein [Pyrinomonadaceae bacterium]|jgi:ketosteroid isomerase-like protein|nr:nuclear transport factor 2 family protein [Pyrinomonadaceae bacterium]
MRCHIATRLPVALITFFIGITTANLTATLWPSAASRTADEQAVLSVEREYLRAHTERDVAALDRVLADDFTSFNGRVNKEQRLALLANPFFVVTSIATDDVSVSVRGDEAWVSGRARMAGSFRGRDFTTPRYGFTRRYERRDGRWQIVSCAFSFAW